MATTIPTGFLLVVGFGVFLLAVLAVLILAWVHDVAKSVRAVAHNLQRMSEILQARPLVSEQPEARALDEAA